MKYVPFSILQEFICTEGKIVKRSSKRRQFCSREGRYQMCNRRKGRQKRKGFANKIARGERINNLERKSQNITYVAC